jgi:hypothetical protein
MVEASSSAWPAVPDGWSWPRRLSACAVHVPGRLDRVLPGAVKACPGPLIGAPASFDHLWTGPQWHFVELWVG